MLVDGEHYPTVVRAAVEELRASGRAVIGAALLGGAEKIPSSNGPGAVSADVTITVAKIRFIMTPRK